MTILPSVRKREPTPERKEKEAECLRTRMKA
jgi:hypothetical protein